MSKKLQSIRGIHDGLPDEVQIWQHIETIARRIFASYSTREVRLPILESTEVFVRSIGTETDIVSKEMYRFEDRNGDDICLRPEGTAGAVRAYLQAGLSRSGTQRWFYMGPMFRRERPQKGRLRQFQQIGVEWFGVAGPIEDIEVLTMASSFLDELGIKTRLEINSLGCPDCRPDYRKKLTQELEKCQDELCGTCQQRLSTNPLRILDCKQASCQALLKDIPEMTEHLCGICDAHFLTLQRGLKELGVPFLVNPRIVRGLDYYNRTAFEFISEELGAQGTVLAGGRYDGLVSQQGGPATSAIGFASGLERLGMLLAGKVKSPQIDATVVALGASTHIFSLQIAHTLRQQGFHISHCGTGSSKALFKRAAREQARYTLVIGEDELARQIISLRGDDEKHAFTLSQLIEHMTAS
ncbi:MAG: histidine--tRNA ligase [Mariprofundaceae bacterium]|nr:histidine--tRNA ligase [Mariprofundaceae bacterium]